MRNRLMLLLAVAVVFGASEEGLAEKFTSARARQAEQTFLKAMKAARDNYLRSLKSAARFATKDKDMDEAARIEETIEDVESQQQGDRGDAVVNLRRNLTNTIWTFNRPGRPATIRFLAGNVAVISGSEPIKGVWESLASDSAIVNVGENLFLFQFDKGVMGYKVRAFGPIKSEYKSGKRTQ